MVRRFERILVAVAFSALLLALDPVLTSARTLSAGAASPLRSSMVIVQVTDRAHISSVRATLAGDGAVVMGSSGDHALLVTVPSGVSQSEFVAEIEAIDGVEFAQANTVMRAFETSNDPKIAYQWGLNAIGATTAWESAEGSGVAIAVIDTGIDNTLPDLAGQVVLYKNYINPAASAFDDNGHGTHVAGIIAATRNNSLGGAGAAPRAEVWAFKVLDASGSGNTFLVAQAIRDAVDHTPCRIISMSLGGPAPGGDTILTSAVAYAQSKGAIVIAAAGNDGVTTPSYPAAISGVMGVGAVDSAHKLATFSNYGIYNLDVVAPGVNIYSTVLGGSMQFWSGTSMATPFVSAAAAVVWSAHPELSAAQLSQVLQNTATDLGASGDDYYYGHGLVRVDRALASLVAVPEEPTATPTPVPTATPEPAPALVSEPSPVPVPDPEPTIDPQPEPEPAPEPVPEPAPAPAPAPEPIADPDPIAEPATVSTTTLSIAQARTSVARYRTVRLSGTLSPGELGSAIRVYVVRPGTSRWIRVRTVYASSLNEAGGARWSYYMKPSYRGTYKIRVKFAGAPTLAASTSRTIKLRVY